MLLGSSEPKILIVDDVETNITIMETYLLPKGYILDRAFDGEEALEKVKEFKPDLILLDLMLPKLDGYEVTKILKNAEETHLIPIIIVTAMADLQNKIRGIELGADDYLMKPYNKLELLARVNSLIRFKKMTDQLESTEATLFALAKTIEAKDKYTEGHSERVSIYSRRLATKIGMSDVELDIMSKGALLHDIGKIGIPEHILCKPAPLDPDEYLIMKEHPIIGSKIAAPLKNSVHIINMIKYHHESFDGSGHPEGLCGDEIPIEARIVSIVDAYDAIVTTRPYRKGSPKNIAFKVLRDGKSRQWDPDLVEAFIEMIEEWEEEKKQKRLAKKMEKVS